MRPGGALEFSVPAFVFAKNLTTDFTDSTDRKCQNVLSVKSVRSVVKTYSTMKRPEGPRSEHPGFSALGFGGNGSRLLGARRATQAVLNP
jgi:hypothetical protein